MTKSGVPASPLVYQPEMMTGEKRHVPFRNGTTQINRPINQFIFFSLGWTDNYSLVQRIHACTPTAHSAVDGRTDGL